MNKPIKSIDSSKLRRLGQGAEILQSHTSQEDDTSEDPAIARSKPRSSGRQPKSSKKKGFSYGSKSLPTSPTTLPEPLNLESIVDNRELGQDRVDTDQGSTLVTHGTSTDGDHRKPDSETIMPSVNPLEQQQLAIPSSDAVPSDQPVSTVLEQPQRSVLPALEQQASVTLEHPHPHPVLIMMMQAYCSYT